MFILIFFLVISISQFVSNKMINLSDDSEDAYTFTKKDSLIIVILLVVGIVLQIVSKMLLTSFYWIAAVVYLLASLTLMLIILQTRKTKLLKQREELQQVYEILQKLVDKKGEGLDFNNPPFTLDYKHGNIQRITVAIDPTTLNITDKGTSPLFLPYVSQLDSFLPTYKWTYDDSHLSMRYLEFVGEEKPPERALWPGSWLRNARFMPLGITGKGEIAFRPDSEQGSIGKSLYTLDNGDIPQADKSTSPAPQALIAGATGGGKSVMVSNILLHCLEHWDKISLLLVDPKIVEFSNYKDMKGVVAVANTLQEAVECLRLSKTVMYKRNKDLEELGLKQIKEYTPHDKSGKVFITGREYFENDTIKIKIDNEERSVTAANLVDIVREQYNKVEVNLNGEVWLEVNEHCVDYIYNDELKMLVIIIDEVAELTEASKGKDALSKEEDAIRSEILAIMKSIAQLGRNAGIHMLVCTQKPTVDILPGTLRSNLGFRAYCGKATEAGPSIVTLNNTLALNTPKEPRGRAIVQSGTLGEFLQVYFSEFKDLEKYYQDRGLDNKGYTLGMAEAEIQTEELTGSEEILDKPEEMNAEFYGEKIHIDRRENQVFEEI